MTVPADFPARIAESRAKHLAPAIGGVAVTSAGSIATTVHGDLSPGALRPHWHIGSCTKAMTATLFARLVDRGALSFDMTLADALPELTAKAAHHWRSLPSHALLTHSAGLPKDPSGATFRALRRSSASPAEQRRFLAADALRELPRPELGYSNLGYILVGAIIERITGRSWEAALAREVMIPLGISEFGFGVPGPGHPTGHRRLHGTWREVRSDNPLAYGPAGRVHLSLEEWGRFLRAHLDPSNFLREATLETLHTPAENGFAMGWLVATRHGERQLIHTGTNTAWFARATIMPDRGLGFGVVCNAFDKRIENAIGDLSRDLTHPAPADAP